VQEKHLATIPCNIL